ncbi:hypothetical protein SARC_17627, partial [Sphaeroforma arctica JP610]
MYQRNYTLAIANYTTILNGEVLSMFDTEKKSYQPTHLAVLFEVMKRVRPKIAFSDVLSCVYRWLLSYAMVVQ